jgi:dTDP-glucose 4,6-dehydratase
MKSRYVVIGSNSFSGSTMIDILQRDPITTEIVGISRSKDKEPPFRAYRQPIEFHQWDLNKDLDKMLRFFDEYQPHYIINFASQSEVAPSWEHPEQWYQTNCMSIVSLANALKDRKYLQRYVHISTPEVYGSCLGINETGPLSPSTPYAASRAAADLFLLCLADNYGFPVTIVRSTNVYGPRQQLFKIIPRTIIYLKQGKKIELQGGGEQVRSFIHIRDVCRGIYKAIYAGKPGEIYHFSPGKGCSIQLLVQTICGMMNVDFNKVTELVKARPGQDFYYVIDSSKAQKELGWRPQISMDKGLKEVIDWIEENWDTILKEPLEYIHK